MECTLLSYRAVGETDYVDGAWPLGMDMDTGDVMAPLSKCDEGSAVDLVGGPRADLVAAGIGEDGHYGVDKALWQMASLKKEPLCVH